MEEKKESVVVVSDSSDSLREQKKKLDKYNATFVKEGDKAVKYIKKHDVDYVLIDAEEYVRLQEKAGE